MENETPPTPDAPPSPVPSLPPVPAGRTLAAQMNATVAAGDLRESLFSDDAPVPGKKLYALALKFHGFNVYANPLKRAEYKRHVREAKALGEELKALGDAKVTPDTEEAAEEAVEAALLRKAAHEREIVASAVVDWDLKNSDGTVRPYNADTLAALRPQHVAELAGIIVQASVVTRAESDF